MIRHVGNINGIPLYEDDSVGEETMLKGSKDSGYEFIIIHPKVSKILLHEILIKERKDKLNRINEI